jgi:predicted alpha/beta-hydrolase family hydrolase
MGIQFARYMLWGPPGFVERATRRKGGTPWDPAVRKALRRFKAELKQRRQAVAAAIKAAALELAERAVREQGGEGMLAISGRAIFERVRLTIPDATFAEVQGMITQSFPYMGASALSKPNAYRAA